MLATDSVELNMTNSCDNEFVGYFVIYNVGLYEY